MFSHTVQSSGEVRAVGKGDKAFHDFLYTGCVFLHDLPMFNKGMAGEMCDGGQDA